MHKLIISILCLTLTSFTIPMEAPKEGFLGALPEELRTEIKFTTLLAENNFNEALIHAIEKQNVSMVEVALKAGADPNAFSRFNFTPLQKALNRKDEIVRLLLNYGADFTKTHPLQSSPWMDEIRRKKSEKNLALFREGIMAQANTLSNDAPQIEKNKLLQKATMVSAKDAIIVLLDKGAKVSNVEGTTQDTIDIAEKHVPEFIQDKEIISLLYSRGE